MNSREADLCRITRKSLGPGRLTLLIEPFLGSLTYPRLSSQWYRSDGPSSFFLVYNTVNPLLGR